MIRYYFFQLCLLLMPLLSFAHEPYSASFRFIENKNQWDSKIKYSADIKSGTLFLEKNCFTYNLIDGQVLKTLHGKSSKNLDSLKINGHAFKVNFENSNLDVVLNAEDEFPDYYNYFLGNDPKKWASKVLAYKIVNYQNLYDGIDMKVYTHGDNLKYDLILLPNSDPSSISFNYEGIDKMSLMEGNLVLQTSLGNIVEQKPYAYQIINDRVVQVACRYVLTNHKLSFHFPNGYNKNQKLIIDPTLVFSTYSGSLADNFGYTATFDSDGFLYSGSSVFGQGYPTTTGAYQTTFQGGTPWVGGQPIGIDIGVTKYDTSGTKRIYSTYLGGNRNELPHSLIVDKDDNLLIFGTTSSSNFPTTKGCYDSTFASGDSIIYLIGISAIYNPGSDIFVTKINKVGSNLLASTYLGGSSNDGLLALSTLDPIPNTNSSTLRFSPLRYNYADEIRGEIEIDKDNNIIIASCTKSKDFPIVGNSSVFNGGNFDAIIIKFNNSLSNIIWSSFLGGNGDDAAYSVEIDTLNNLYVSGGTTSNNFPTTNGVMYPNFSGGRSDGFITNFDKDGNSIIYSSYFGSSSYDQIYFIDLDRFNNVYVFGQTEAPDSTFIYNAIFSEYNSGQFISKLNGQLKTLIWSTVFGTGAGYPDISPTAFLVDLCSKVYLSGWGGESNTNGSTVGLRTKSTSGFFQNNTDGSDFYLFVLEDDASDVHYASFFGGSAAEHVDGGTSRFDKKGRIYQAMCAGCRGTSDMPLKPALGSNQLPSINRSSNCNIGVFKMDFNLPIVVADFSVEPGCPNEPIQFQNKSKIQNDTKFEWIFGDGTTNTDPNPVHTYASGGYYDVKLIVKDNGTCNLTDTIIKRLYISTIADLVTNATADDDTIYKGHSTTLHAIPNSGYFYQWTPSGSLNNYQSANPIATPDTTTTYTLTIIDPLVQRCTTVARVQVVVLEINCGLPDIYIPNAFTPNADGKNEILYVRSNNIKEMFFTIYDRWGEKVFETNDQEKGWDGTYKGMKADPGVFVYYLEVTCVDDQKFFKKGNITLIR